MPETKTQRGRGRGSRRNADANAEGLPVVLEEEAIEAEAAETEGKQRLDIRTLKDMSISELTHVARDLEVENPAGMRKQDLIFKILQVQTEREGLIFGEGVLEILPDGYGFLRAPEYNYLPGPTISTSHPRRSGASTSGRATRFRARSVHRARASGTSP